MAQKKQKFAIPQPMAKRKRKWSIVEEVIAAVNKRHGVAKLDDPAELRQRLSDYAGRRLDPQLIYGWRQRGAIPRNWVPIVAEVSGVPMEKMIQDKPLGDE